MLVVHIYLNRRGCGFDVEHHLDRVLARRPGRRAGLPDVFVDAKSLDGPNLKAEFLAGDASCGPPEAFPFVQAASRPEPRAFARSVRTFGREYALVG